MKKLLAAIAFAANKHRNQRRKDHEASPYINHPITLANILANEGGIEDERVLIASVLHDTIEDTETSVQELVKLFGQEVTEIVLEVTDDKSLPKAERKRLQVEHAATISRRAKLVKLADKIANLRDIAASPPEDWGLERKREYFNWARSVVDMLRGVHPELEWIFDEAYRLNGGASGLSVLTKSSVFSSKNSSVVVVIVFMPPPFSARIRATRVLGANGGQARVGCAAAHVDGGSKGLSMDFVDKPGICCAQRWAAMAHIHAVGHQELFDGKH